MNGKQFKVHAEGYQDTDDMGYAIAPPVTYYHVGNSEIGFNFDTEREAKMLCEAWNKLVEENEQLEEARAYYQGNFLTMKTERNQFKRENEQLKKELDQFYLLIGRGDWSGLVDLIKGDVE